MYKEIFTECIQENPAIMESCYDSHCDLNKVNIAKKTYGFVKQIDFDTESQTMYILCMLHIRLCFIKANIFDGLGTVFICYIDDLQKRYNMVGNNKNLPRVCYATDPNTGRTALIRLGYDGMFELCGIEGNIPADELNEQLGVSGEEAKLMFQGAMNGWSNL